MDEVWSIRLPNKDEKEKLGNTRVIEIAKSREDNSGRKFYVSRNDDYTLKIEENTDIAENTAQSGSDQLLGALRHHDKWMNVKEILALPLGTKGPTRKVNLSRLVHKGLVDRKGKKGSYQYRAVLAHAKSDNAICNSSETQVVPGVVPAVTAEFHSDSSKQEKDETQKTTSSNETSLPEVVTEQNPVPDSDDAGFITRNQTLHARDPFDSTGLTD